MCLASAMAEGHFHRSLGYHRYHPRNCDAINTLAEGHIHRDGDVCEYGLRPMDLVRFMNPGALPWSLPKFHFVRFFTPKALYYRAQGQRTT
ncbi:MAG: hypothetical protein QF886_02095, partial [Planctomycetota bacterium]|nr:hypothetical protein [Planctomycetota bacterium]